MFGEVLASLAEAGRCLSLGWDEQSLVINTTGKPVLWPNYSVKRSKILFHQSSIVCSWFGVMFVGLIYVGIDRESRG